MPTSVRQQDNTQLVFTSEVLVKPVCSLWIGLRGLERIVEKKCTMRFFHNLITCIKYFHPFSCSRTDNKIMHI